jgi:hypothetical protein
VRVQQSLEARGQASSLDVVTLFTIPNLEFTRFFTEKSFEVMQYVA